MVFSQLPVNPLDAMDWSWSDYQPFIDALQSRSLDALSVEQWLLDWTQLSDLIAEVYARLNVATTADTSDQDAERRFNAFLDEIYPAAQAAQQLMKEKLLASGLEPEGFDVPLRRMQAEAAIFRVENLPLLSEERKLGSAYNKIIGAQTVEWQGGMRTLQQMRTYAQTPDRDERERIWRLVAGRQLEDRQVINELWSRFLKLRVKIAENAQLPNYLDYRWQQMLRLDYDPQDCQEFHNAIEQIAVPAATRVYERHKEHLEVDHLRPWDLDQDIYPIHLPALPTYGNVNDLVNGLSRIFHGMDSHFAGYFSVMQGEGLLDLENRLNKAPGGYCTSYPISRRPFIFMNAIGLPGDIRTLLHESGHSFHNFERFDLPYAQQRVPGLEFAEVASMTMELFAYPYLSEETGGFYETQDADRFRTDHLEHILIFWPYMAVVDAFQDWVYHHPQVAMEVKNCDAKWLELWQRYIPGVDWRGLEDQAMTGWHRKQHIHRAPLYYVEYGLAQLGAVQIWQSYVHDPQATIDRYRQALKLGGKVPLPELYRTAGAKFAFDAQTLDQAVEFIERQLAEYADIK